MIDNGGDGDNRHLEVIVGYLWLGLGLIVFLIPAMAYIVVVPVVLIVVVLPNVFLLCWYLVAIEVIEFQRVVFLKGIPSRRW